MRRWWGALLGSLAIAVLAIFLALSHQAIVGPGRSFDTPEAAVTHFVNRLAADDFDGAMEAFAIDDYAQHFDFAAMARRLRSFNATFMDGPVRYKMYVRINALKAASDYADQTMQFSTSMLLDDAAFDRLRRLAQAAMSDADMDALALAMDPAKLRTLKIVRIDPPLKSLTTAPKATQLAREQAVAVGAENSTDRIALLQLNGTYYRAGFNLLKYGKTWRLRRLSSYYAEVSGAPGRNVAKTTVEEYLKLTK